MSVEPETTAICELLTHLVRSIVTDKEAVDVIVRDPDLDPIVIQIKVAQGSDVGKLIGRQGRTARSLRIIFHAIMKESGTNRKYHLDILT